MNLRCPKCKTVLRLDTDRSEGPTKARCPGCQTTLTVPRAKAEVVVFRAERRVQFPEACIACFREEADSQLVIGTFPQADKKGPDWGRTMAGAAGYAAGGVVGGFVAVGLHNALSGHSPTSPAPWYQVSICGTCVRRLRGTHVNELAAPLSQAELLSLSWIDRNEEPPLPPNGVVARDVSNGLFVLRLANAPYARAFREMNRGLVFATVLEAVRANAPATQASPDAKAAPPASGLKETKPRLYEQLVSLNEELSTAAGCTFLTLVLASIGLCVGIHFGWFDGVLGNAVAARAQSWVFYVVVVGASVLFGAFLGSHLEARAYRRGRGRILPELRRAGIDRPLLLSLIAEDKRLSCLAAQLKRDRDADIGV